MNPLNPSHTSSVKTMSSLAISTITSDAENTLTEYLTKDAVLR